MKTSTSVPGRAATGVFAAFMAVLLFLSGCATPVGVHHLTPHEAHQKLTASVLSGDTLSAPTKQILNRSGLAAQFKSEPDRVIATIHKGLPTVQEADRLFALAELSFLHASNGGGTAYFLSAAIYAYVYLFPKDATASPDPFDPRFRLAVELYNEGIARGFRPDAGKNVVLREGTYKTSFGDLAVTIDPDEFRWGSFRLINFVDSAELEVRGLRNWYRWPGMGAPLVASLERLPGVEDSAFARIPPGIKVAAIAVLKPDHVEEGLKIGHIAGKLVLVTTEEGTSIAIDSRSTDNMAPESPFVKAISSMPVAPGIIAHSIIPVKNPDDPKEKWNDGVVEYKSAHIDGVASELIVHSGHSTQGEPQTIEEVRRILIENLKEP
jgi:hypothetical protein